MAALHDMQCSACGDVVHDAPLAAEHTPCICGRGVYEIYWSSKRTRDAAVHARERAVVWRHPGTGEVRYPGRNDVQMPARYRRQGFERHEMPSLRALESFERTANVRSEKAWFDPGTGRGFDDKER